MYKVSFKGCRAKIERAKQHRDALESYIAAILGDKRNCGPLRADLDPESGYYVISVQAVPDLSAFQEAVGVMVGDIVHNLRSALDHLAWQLACANTGGTPTKPHRVQFPIEDTRVAFDEECKPGGQIHEIAPTHQTRIERHQPYNRLDSDSYSGPYTHPLVLLRDLSNVDKHRLLPTVLLLPAHRLELEGGPSLRFTAVEWRIGDLDHAMELGAQVCRARLLGDSIQPHVDVIGHVTPAVALDERRPVVSTIDRIAAYVINVIREFEPLF